MRPHQISEDEFTAMQARVRAVAPKLEEAIRKNTSPYRSKWEENFAAKLELEKRANVIKDWRYEPMSFKLAAGKRYRPDFLIDRGYGPLECVDVKGWHKNKRDGITHLKWAAQLYPMFVWRLVYRTKDGGWDGEYV